MANKALIAVVGPSGSGKSTSLRNLNPETTVIIDLERKGFPFKGWERFKVLPAANIAEADKHLDAALADTKVEVIVIESLTKYLEMLLGLAQRTQKGFEIYTFYNRGIGTFLEKVKNDHAVIVMTAIDEIVKVPMTDGSEIAQRRISTKGREWEGKVEKEFLMVLFTEPKRNKTTGKVEYFFQTNTDGTTSAKTPMAMFNEELVGNDVAEMLKKAKEYYLTEKLPQP